MAKKKNKEKKTLGPPPPGYVLVRSKRHGDHYRKKKQIVELNDGMKASQARTRGANFYAKAINDPLDPFRKGIEDGSFWNNLGNVFREQIKRGRVDFTKLKNYQCHSQFPLTRFMHRELTGGVSENNTLDLEVLTYGDVKAKWEKAEEYRQILIVVFYDAELKAKVESKTVFFPLGKEKRNKQQESFPVPQKSTMALIALRCDFWNEVAVGGSARQALEILTVMELRGVIYG